MHLQIRVCVNDLKKENSRLQTTWKEQRDRLDQVLEFQQFLRDAKNIDAMSGAHEVIHVLYAVRYSMHTVVYCTYLLLSKESGSQRSYLK